MSTSMARKRSIVWLLLAATLVTANAWALTPQVAERTAAQLAADAMAAYQRKEFAASARLYQAAVEKGAADSETLYNAACSLALAGDKERALEFALEAVRAGFRNVEHLERDTDLASLHGDPRWKEVVAECRRQMARYVEEHGDPDRTRIVTTDVDRFWAAYEKAIAVAPAERAAILEREYIEPGTIGLRDFARSGRVNAATLAKRLETHPEFFKAIRSATSSIQTHRGEIVAAFRKLKALYPQATFPDCYFVVGALQSGGTASENGLLMGAEMFTRSSALPMSELGEWERGAVMPQSDIPALVAHEAIHFQQRASADRSLLMACLKEGSADFLGKLTSGRLIARMEETHVWANSRERELWEEFRKEMYGEDRSRWLYGSSGGNGRPVDLGYWIGYKIAEAYYERSPDKQAAVRAIFEITDAKQFLEASRYAEKLGSK